jgi:hypothetical protein
MLLRKIVVLTLTLTGITFLVLFASEDPPAAKLIAGCGCFVLARVYWEVSRGGVR